MTDVHILVAEDNHPNRILMKTYLRKFEFSCMLVENGSEAVSAVGADDFDLVLMDVQMPLMDGLEATRRIRQMDKPLGDIPILGLTASVHEEALERCIDAGMNTVVAKPIKAADLLAQINKYLNLS